MMHTRHRADLLAGDASEHAELDLNQRSGIFQEMRSLRFVGYIDDIVHAHAHLAEFFYRQDR
jgi:hypothetical protein